MLHALCTSFVALLHSLRSSDPRHIGAGAPFRDSPMIPDPTHDQSSRITQMRAFWYVFLPSSSRHRAACLSEKRSMPNTTELSQPGFWWLLRGALTLPLDLDNAVAFQLGVRQSALSRKLRQDTYSRCQGCTVWAAHALPLMTTGQVVARVALQSDCPQLPWQDDSRLPSSNVALWPICQDKCHLGASLWVQRGVPYIFFWTL